jgi:uncharacterized protein YndB with AHSA1/START domain
MTHPGTASAIVRRRLPATPDEVYDEWLDPESLIEWMCPRPARCVHVEADPRIGGRLRIDIEEEGRRFFVHGTYTDLVRPDRIGFTWSCSTWPDPELVTHVLVTLVPHGDRETTMTITHTALTPELREQHQRGWHLIAAQLDAAVRARSA